MAARTASSAYSNEVDVFLCPANFTAAFPQDARPFDERMITTADGERPYTDQNRFLSRTPRCWACRPSPPQQAVRLMAFRSAFRSLAHVRRATPQSGSPR